MKTITVKCLAAMNSAPFSCIALTTKRAKTRMKSDRTHGYEPFDSGLVSLVQPRGYAESRGLWLEPPLR